MSGERVLQEWEVDSVEESWEVAAEVAALLRPGMVLALSGELGAGKTTFMQGVAAALGVTKLVTSPTFTLCVEYQARDFLLVHFDLYRLAGAGDLLETGFYDYLEQGAVVAVEWPERAEGDLPADTLHLRISHGSGLEDRSIELSRAL